MNTEYSSIHALRNLFQCHRHPFLLRTAAPTHKLGQCLAAHVALDCDLLSRFLLEVAIILPFLQTQTCRLSRVVWKVLHWLSLSLQSHRIFPYITISYIVPWKNHIQANPPLNSFAPGSTALGISEVIRAAKMCFLDWGRSFASQVRRKLPQQIAVMMWLWLKIRVPTGPRFGDVNNFEPYPCLFVQCMHFSIRLPKFHLHFFNALVLAPWTQSDQDKMTDSWYSTEALTFSRSRVMNRSDPIYT